VRAFFRIGHRVDSTRFPARHGFHPEIQIEFPRGLTMRTNSSDDALTSIKSTLEASRKHAHGSIDERQNHIFS